MFKEGWSETVIRKRSSITVEFISATKGQQLGPSVALPLDTTPEIIEKLLNELLENDEELNYTFSIRGVPIIGMSIEKHLKFYKLPIEKLIKITFAPLSAFRIRAVTRCAVTLSDHQESVLVVAFSPDGNMLCSGSGDATVRFWNLNTCMADRGGENPHFSWVLSLSWSPDGIYLASGGMDKIICTWNSSTKKPTGIMEGHNGWITSLSWEPSHIKYPSRRLVSGSRDGSVRIWDVLTHQCVLCMKSHTQSVKSVRWGGEKRIYSASADGNIKIWDSESGTLINTLKSHSHWVNTLALSTDHILRTGIFEKTIQNKPATHHTANMAIALRRYKEATSDNTERLVSGSDDSTMFIWTHKSGKSLNIRLMGHTQPVNHVCFSPNGMWLASSSFDKSIKIWDGFTGQNLMTFNKHLAPVYMCAWSIDSRYIVSASKDSTIKIWDIKKQCLKDSLPGHSDAIFAIDWSPEGSTVASGGKDKLLKLWKH